MCVLSGVGDLHSNLVIALRLKPASYQRPICNAYFCCKEYCGVLSSSRYKKVGRCGVAFLVHLVANRHC